MQKAGGLAAVLRDILDYPPPPSPCPPPHHDAAAAGGGGAVKEDEQRPVSGGITLKVKGEVKDDGDTKDLEVPQGKDSRRSAL